MSRFRFVEDHRDTYQVKRLCELVEVSTSGFYTWQKREPSARSIADAELLEELRTIHLESRCTYGAPRIHGQLRRRGRQIGCKRVARLMRQDGLLGVHKRKWRRRRPDIAPAPDRLNRNFTAARPNQRWVADTTEFPTGEGKLHVAGIRDLCHRGLVGWSMGRAPTPSSLSMRSSWPSVVANPMTTVSSTTATRRCLPVGRLLLDGHRRRPAGLVRVDRDCWDNAAMETFWSILKREITWIRGSIYFATREEARLYLFEFIEVFYNRQRHQAALGHLTPVEFGATFTP